MKKILIFSNIPSPYRVDFYNELGRYVDLTVVFEARRAKNITFSWNDDKISYFSAIFLSDGEINEKKVNWKISSILKTRNDYDIIIFTNIAYYTELFAIAYCLVTHTHYGLEIDGILPKRDLWYKKITKQKIFSNAEFVFCPSRMSAKELVHYKLEEFRIYKYNFTSLFKKDILSEPINIPDKKKLKESLGIFEDKMILYVGQFIYRKGLDVLLSALQDISLDFSVALVCVGGKIDSLDTSILSPSALKRLYCVDFKPKNILDRYYMAADLFVLPTREDIWGLVINEAMAHGLPVITTKNCVAGVELVQDMYNGLLVDVNDSNKLCEAVSLILSDELLCAKMQKNALKVIKEYSIEESVLQHMKVLGSFRTTK
jgi:glycosyltransferase involved in cell wall biosynthesis